MAGEPVPGLHPGYAMAVLRQRREVNRGYSKSGDGRAASLVELL